MTYSKNLKHNSTDGHHQMEKSEIKLTKYSKGKTKEISCCQQEHIVVLTMAQITNFLLQSCISNQRKIKHLTNMSVYLF